MTESVRETLVLITGRYQDVIEELRAFATVTQMLPPSLALVMLPDEQRDAIPEITGAVFYVDDIPPEVVDDLPQGEQIFIRAWQIRSLSKKRHGDQLPWDSPGYTPPDAAAD